MLVSLNIAIKFDANNKRTITYPVFFKYADAFSTKSL